MWPIVNNSSEKIFFRIHDFFPLHETEINTIVNAQPGHYK